MLVSLTYSEILLGIHVAGQMQVQNWMQGRQARYGAVKDFGGALGIAATGVLGEMAVAKAALLKPQEEAVVPVTRKALVIGGGVAGIQAALDLGDTGYKVYLVEKKPSIGGKMAQLDKTFPTMDCSICILAPKMSDVGKHPNIELITNSEVTEVSGYIGNFAVKIRKKPRYVTKDCTACGDCVDVCPIEVPNEFELGLSSRKAIYIPFAQSVPTCYLIDEKSCIGLENNTCARCKRCGWLFLLHINRFQ